MRYRNLRKGISKQINCRITNETYSYLYEVGGNEISIGASIDKLAEEHRNYVALSKSSLRPASDRPKT